MVMITFDDDLHAAGERMPVRNKTITRSLAWWVAAELIRRHPDTLRVIETHPGGGQYDCLSIYTLGPDRTISSAETVVHLNVNPSSHITPESWPGPGDSERFNWLEVLLCDDRRSYVVHQIERAERLPPPGETPSTTPASIGPMVISAFLERSILGPARWIALNGVHDSSNIGSWVRSELFDRVPGARAWSGDPDSPTDFDERAYPYWFVCDEMEGPGASTDTIFVVDTWNGRILRPGGIWIDLMKRYDTVGRSLDALVSAVCPPAH